MHLEDNVDRASVTDPSNPQTLNPTKPIYSITSTRGDIAGAADGGRKRKEKRGEHLIQSHPTCSSHSDPQILRKALVFSLQFIS
jgi:hypothetical protein